MKNSIQHPVVLARLAALTAASAGAFSLVTWSAGEWRVAALGANYVPMAPVTALLFVLLGLAFSARLHWPDSRLARRLCAAGAGLTGLVAGLVLIQLWWKMDLPWDHWFMRTVTQGEALPVGRMSPLTALTFLLTAAALLGQSTGQADRNFVRRGIYLLAGAGLAVGGVVAASYAAAPLFYGGTTVPMALLTALAFMALNASILLAGQVDKLLRAWRELEAAPDIPAENRRFTLWLILSLLITGTLIALAGLFYLRREQAAAREVVQQSLEAIASLKANQINTWRNERLGEARFLQRTPAVLRDVTAFAAAPDDPAARARLLGWLEPIKGGDRYAAIFVLDAQARPLLAVPASAAPTSRVSPELFAQALASAEPLFGDLQRDAGDSAVHLDLLVPVRPAAAAAPIGVLVLRLDPAQYLYPLIQSWPVPSDSAESLLVRQEGEEIVYLNELRHRPGTAVSLRRSINERSLAAVQALRDARGVREGLDYRGVPVLSVGRSIPGSPWILIAKVDQAEAYAVLQHDFWHTGLEVVLLLVAIVLAGVSLWRQRHANVLRRILALERARKAMTERLALIMRQSNDAILIIDENMRIIEAGERALSLYGYSAEEILRLTVADLRAPAARATVKEDYLRVLHSEGRIFETLHLRRDGTLIPVEVSTRPIEHAGQRYVLSVIRDITERQAHLRQIERMNRLYAALSQVNQTIVHATDRDGLLKEICRVLVEFGRFKMAWIGWRDPATGEVRPAATWGDEAGYLDSIHIFTDDRPEAQGPAATTLRENRTDVSNDITTDPRLAPWRAAMDRSGYRSAIALPLRRDGEARGR